MNDTVAILISFLVMLNPFAMFVFLEPVRRDMEDAHFKKMLLRASVNSTLLFVLFYLSGDFLFITVLQIDFESFRVFGGIVIFSVAYLYIITDRKAVIQPKKDISDLALDVSLPFMVGAGTISLSILLRQVAIHPALGVLTIVSALIINHLIILGLGYTRLVFIRKTDKFDKLMDATMRINIFFIGAIGVDMIIKGIHELLV